LSPALRTRRLLALTLRDLRRLTTNPVPRIANYWEGRIYSRLSALPEQAEPLQRTQLVAALAVGTEIIRLRRIARRFDLQVELDPALDALAQGDTSVAIELLAHFDRMLAALPRTVPGAWARLRARGSISHDVGIAGSPCRVFRFGSSSMRFVEIDVFGVYVAPISLMMLAAWIVLIALRRAANRFGSLRLVWRPALFEFAIYTIVLSSFVLIVAG
jgi:hypothetical protein